MLIPNITTILLVNENMMVKIVKYEPDFAIDIGKFNFLNNRTIFWKKRFISFFS